MTNKGAIDPAAMPPQYEAGAWSIHRTPITLAAPELGTNLEELRAAVDDDETWRQEFLAEFIDGSSVLLPYDVMARCESVSATLSITPEEMSEPGRGPWFGGLDFGRTGDPSVLWLLEKVGDVLWTRAVKLLRNENTVDQFEHYEPYLRRCARACIDYTGPGVGFGDMAEKRFGAVRNAGGKAGVFPKLRSAFDAVRLRVPSAPETREDLHEMQQVIINGSYNYTARRTAEGHSDRCTALALAVRAAESPTWRGSATVVDGGGSNNEETL